jgi:hypothetical protein
MMPRTLTHSLTALAFTVALVPAGVQADGLLWKATSRYQASVVPPYTGQASPFPSVVMPSEDTSSTEGPTLEDMEVERLQQEAVDHATQLIGSPQALVPYMEGAVVGGMVQGAGGRKILVGNEWVGPGMSMNVRLMASDAVREAINKVSDFNQDTAKSLKEQLSQRLRQTPVTKMKLKEIRTDSLVLVGDYGQQVMKFVMH